MGEKHPNAKHDDETWIGFLERCHAGEASAKLRLEAGVSADTWSRHAERLRMRVMDLAEDHPARRRGPTPPYDERDDDHVDPRSDVSEGQWRAGQDRRIAGEAMADIAADLGVHEETCAQNLRKRYGRKADHPDAVARPRGRGVMPRPARDPEIRAACVFELVEGDVDASLASVDAAKRRAAASGHAEAVEHLSRASVAMANEEMSRLRLGKAREKAARRGGAEGRPPHPSATPTPSPERGGREPHPSAAAASPERGGKAVALHDHQKPPPGDWGTWLVLGGRGAGKTLAGASWAAEEAERLGAGGRIALIGATLHDVREVMVEGPSGLMGLDRWQGPDGWDGPTYEPSRRRVKFPGGAYGYAFSAEDPDSLRGPQFHAAWADEFCAWGAGGREGGALAMARLGLRLGQGPRLCVTTTPRPTRALKGLMAEPGLVMTRAGTAANAEHLAAGFVAGLERLYGGTRLAAQELEGLVVETGESLFTAGMLAGARSGEPPDMERVVVGVDPAAGGEGSETGIVVVGRAGDRAYVLADRTCGGVSPEGWARAVAEAARTYGAAEVVAEVNQGGAMVSSVLKAAGVTAPVTAVRAADGKRARAEPVAALYEQGRVRHAGAGLERLEEGLMGLGEAGAGGLAKGLDRVDALVWAVTALMLGETREPPRIRGFERADATGYQRICAAPRPGTC